jgi:hypothetical protein
MNLNIFVESHTILMEQQLESLTSLMENPVIIAPQLEHMMKPQIQLPISPIGEKEHSQISNHSVHPSVSKNETNSANQLSNLKSNVKPHELLEKPPEVRLLKVSKEDIKALCQVIIEFQEQFLDINY